MTTPQSFISQYNGKAIDVDGVYGAQCYDAIVKQMQLCQGVVGNPHMAWSGGARDFFEHFYDLPTVNAKYNRITNQPWNASQLPTYGDILIWGGNLPGSQGYGHGAMYSHVPYAHAFMSYDQNWGGAYLHAVNHNWSYILGWLTPKNGQAPPPPPPPPSGGKTLHLPAVPSWHVYRPNGPYDIAHAIGALDPAKYGGLTYNILGNPVRDFYLIQTQSYGEVAIYGAPSTGAIIN